MLYPGHHGNNMTYSIGAAGFPGLRVFWLAGALAALVTAGGCSTSGAGNAPTSREALAAGPQDSGSFPNLNIPPRSAATQLTADETKAKLSQLKDTQTVAQSGPSAPSTGASDAQLKSLAANHGKDTLQQIEGQQGGTKCDPALDPTCK
jgi:hypothetical protein